MAFGNILGQQPDLNNYALKTDLSNYLPLTGGTVTGPTTVNGVLKTNQNPTQALQVATKQYVDTTFTSDRVLLGSTTSTFTNNFNTPQTVNIQCNSSATSYKYLELLVTINNNNYLIASNIAINLIFLGAGNTVMLEANWHNFPSPVYFNIKSNQRNAIYNELNNPLVDYKYYFTDKGYFTYTKGNVFSLTYMANGDGYRSGNISLNFQLYGIK